MKKMIILGCGGHARSALDTIEALGEYKVCGFVDRSEQKSFSYRGYKVIGCDDDLQRLYDLGVHYAFVGVGFLGGGNTRDNIYEQLKEIGYGMPAIIDPTAITASDVRVGEGTLVGKGAVLNANSVIGNMAIINTCAVIEHDCRVGDFSHVSVSSVVCGGADIGNHVFLGANSTVFQGVKVGNHAVVGAGSIVNKDIEQCEKYISKIVSTRILKQRGN